jgi:hypothetical protein
VRMGVPRLVALHEGGDFDAPNEIVPLPPAWNLYWEKSAQSKIEDSITAFADAVERHKTAVEGLRSIRRWRRREVIEKLELALLQPRADNNEWDELQRLLQTNKSINWKILLPSNIHTEWDLLKESFDLLIVDAGLRGTPREMLGYIHALGIPQIRLCRVDNEKEALELGRFLDPNNQKEERKLFEQDPTGVPIPASIPRFLDGAKLDKGMQPVIFWTTPKEAADHILETMRRISAFRGLSREDGGTSTKLDTHESAKRYFEQYWRRAERGTVFISFAGRGKASALADRLAKILSFLYFRCFHYRNEDSSSDGRLESGEDVEPGLKRHINDADIVVYLIEEKFLKSRYCLDEGAEGVKLLKQGQIELRAYCLDTLTKRLNEEFSSISVHEFRNKDWSHTDVEQKIVADVEQSAKAIGWALREKERGELSNWFGEIGRNSTDGVLKLLSEMGVPEDECKTIKEAAGQDDWQSTVLRLPKDQDKQKRARQIVTLLLLAVSQVNPDRRQRAAQWLSERHLLTWTPTVAADNQHLVEIDDSFIGSDPDARTIRNMALWGQKVGQKHPEVLRGRQTLCVVAKTEFLAIPIEWACETPRDEPIAVQRPVCWRLPDVDTRPSVFDSIASNAIPPTTLILALPGRNINPGEQGRQLNELLRSRYEDLGWPPELVSYPECKNASQVLSYLRRCRQQVVHIAGHMGGGGLQVGEEQIGAIELASALQESEVRLVVLNGCEGGKSTSPVAVAYRTLAERLIRDGKVPEVVAHRRKISEKDALEFAKEFHRAFFDRKEGFEPARAARVARKAGSPALRYSPVVISQRQVGNLYQTLT